MNEKNDDPSVTICIRRVELQQRAGGQRTAMTKRERSSIRAGGECSELLIYISIVCHYLTKSTPQTP
jgi:hypothetical protein